MIQGYGKEFAYSSKKYYNIHHDYTKYENISNFHVSIRNGGNVIVITIASQFLYVPHVVKLPSKCSTLVYSLIKTRGYAMLYKL